MASASSDLPRVLVVHNFYQHTGGEDQVFRAEVALLRRYGHEVREYVLSNEAIGARPSPRTALETVWSARSARRLRQVLREFQPDIAHFHNTFPLISPSAYYVCKRAGVAVVQSVHHYRWGCPSANLWRDGHLCEDCLGKRVQWPGVLHGCYHGSRATSAVIALMNMTHHALATWQSQVDAYIALSAFQREKLIAAGLPAERIAIKGNFLSPDPGSRQKTRSGVLYVGRLIPEKGLSTLLDVWEQAGDLPPLKIVGTGPLARDVGGVQWLGRRSPEQVQALMGEALALIVPSQWHEPFGLVAIEAFAHGTPVIAARAGALPEIVDDQRTGLVFEPGSVLDLSSQVHWAVEHPDDLARMGRAARERFEQDYTAERNYVQLMKIYGSVLRAKRV